MTSPLKPWERAATPAASGVSLGTGHRVQSGGLNRPPVPRRPRQVARPGYPVTNGFPGSYDGLGGYGGLGYGGLGYSGLGGIGGYNRFGGYGAPFGGYSSFNPMMSRGLGWQRPEGGLGFARGAEESSQQAFQSIASAVQAFSAVALMLDSTFYAVYNSFRAVLGVAVHFSQLKTQVVQGMSSSSILQLVQRALRLFNRLLVWLKLRSPGPETVWQDVGGESVDAAKVVSKRRSAGSWPIMIYLAVALGAPWLIWTMLRRTENDEVVTPEWATGQGRHYVAQALYDFTAENRQELSIQAGSMLFVAPQESQPRIQGWLLAACDGQEGLVPMNYVQFLQNTDSSSNSSPDARGVSGIGTQNAASAVNPRSNVDPTMSGDELTPAWDSGSQTHLPPTTSSWQGPRAPPSTTFPCQVAQGKPYPLPHRSIPQSAGGHALLQRPEAPVGQHRAPQTVGLPSRQLERPNQDVSSTANQPVCEPSPPVQSSYVQPAANTLQLRSGVGGDLKTSTALGGLQPSPPEQVVQRVTEQPPVLGKISNSSDDVSANSQTEQPVDTSDQSSHQSRVKSSEGSS